MTVSSDDRRRTDAAVLDHRSLHQDARDAPPDLQNTAMPSPTPLNDRSAMTTVVIRDAPQHPVEAIRSEEHTSDNKLVYSHYLDMTEIETKALLGTQSKIGRASCRERV